MNRIDVWRHDPATLKQRIELAFALMFVSGVVAVASLVWFFGVLR